MAGQNERVVYRSEAGATSRHGVTPLDQAAWSTLRQSKHRSEFAAGWLTLQCRTLGQVRRAVVVLEEREGGGFGPVASWPADAEDLDALGGVAEAAMNQHRGVVQAAAANQEPTQGDEDGPGRQVAYPVIVGEAVCGVVALELLGRNERELRQAMRQLQWGIGWLEVLLRRETAAETAATQERVAGALDLIAAALEHPAYAASCTAVATELAARLGCARVGVGLVRRGHCRLAGLSHTAEIGRRMNLVRAIEHAMDECVDQRTALHYVAGLGGHGDVWVTRAHAELSRQHGAHAVLTVPLTSGADVVGAIVLEHDDHAGFTPRRMELAEAVGAVVGPILEEKRANDRWLIGKAVDSLRTQLVRLIGPGYFGRKLAVTGLVALVAFFAWYRTDYRVTADARLEGAVQRSLAAPYDGYLREAAARPGDLVSAGAVLARLDDRDLVLERLGRVAEQRQLELELNAALADGERAELNILEARIRQIDARIALIDEQLERAEIRAPFDGVVVSGDLSQEVGAAVQRGQPLLQLAPLQDYRIVLQVDERDVDALSEGQTGTLRVASLPDTRIPFEVARLTPVSEPRDGRNTFRVEARPVEAGSAAPTLLPGMEGVGKVRVDERRLIWIWTHRAVEWLRLTAWRWLP